MAGAAEAPHSDGTVAAVDGEEARLTRMSVLQQGSTSETHRPSPATPHGDLPYDQNISGHAREKQESSKYRKPFVESKLAPLVFSLFFPLLTLLSLYFIKAVHCSFCRLLYSRSDHCCFDKPFFSMLFVMVKLGIAALPALGILGLAWEVLDRYMPLPNHVIRPLQQRRRDRQAEGLRRLEVNDQLVGSGLLNWESCRTCPLENPINVGRQAAGQSGEIAAICHQAVLLRILTPIGDQGQSVLPGQRSWVRF